MSARRSTNYSCQDLLDHIGKNVFGLRAYDRRYEVRDTGC